MKRLARATSAGARQAWLLRNRSAFGQSSRRDRPRLLIDVSGMIRHDAQTGIQRVVRAVWSELRKQAGHDFEALPVYATKSHGYCYAPVNFLDRIERTLGRDPVCVSPGDKFLGLDMSAHLLPKYRPQLKAWRRNGATLHIVVYDLLPLLQPDWFNAAAVSHFRRWLQTVVEDADQAICISDQVARDLLSGLDDTNTTRRPEVARLHMGGDIAASIPSKGVDSSVRRVLERVRFRPAILMVGTIEPRKGYDAALAAFEHLWRTRPAEAPDLVVVGKSGWKTEALQRYMRSHPENGARLHWLDSVSDEGLCLLYEGCMGVLMASRAEGFGLPLIEAASHCRPVLARDLLVFREQGLPNVRFFSSDRPADLADRLIDLAHAPHRAGVAKIPTWSDCVEALLGEIGFAVEKPVAEPVMRKAS